MKLKNSTNTHIQDPDPTGQINRIHYTLFFKRGEIFIQNNIPIATNIAMIEYIYIFFFLLHLKDI